MAAKIENGSSQVDFMRVFNLRESLFKDSQWRYKYKIAIYTFVHDNIATPMIGKPELSSVHGSLFLNPTGEKLTRPTPRLPTKSLTRTDPTRGTTINSLYV